MQSMRHLVIAAFILLLAVQSVYSQDQSEVEKHDRAGSPCSEMTILFADRIAPLLQSNDFSNFDPLLQSYASGCGSTELYYRIKILQSLIEKKSTDTFIDSYLDQGYDNQLIARFDDGSHTDFMEIYKADPEKYGFLPLRHPLDELTKIKAEALLASDQYSFTEMEEVLLLLFSDQIDSYLSHFNKPVPPQKEKTRVRDNDIMHYRSRYSGVLYAGMIGPLGASNPIFKLNPTFGLQIMSPIDRLLFFELGAKIQVNSGSRNFDYLLYGEIEDVNSDISYYFGGNLGFVAIDQDRFLLTPKMGIGFKSVSTGLSEVSNYDYDYGYDDDMGSAGIRYHNVNTMDLNFSLAAMRHIRKKNYIGLEVAYHFIPYNWDKNLQTDIFSHYASLELLFRF